MDPSDRYPFRGYQNHSARGYDMKHYQGYSVSTMPLDRPAVPPGFPPLPPAPSHLRFPVLAPGPAPGPAPAPAPVPMRESEEEDEDEDDSEVESVDFELERMVLKPPPAAVPCQLARFHHQLKVGVFVATIEMLTDRGDGTSIEQIRAFALQHAEDLINSTGEVRVPEDPLRPICGNAKIQRDLKRMSHHVEYINDLCNKFIEEFDGTEERVWKLVQATGYIKGLLARDGQEVFNITEKSSDSEFANMLDIFKVNAVLFIEWLKKFQTQ